MDEIARQARDVFARGASDGWDSKTLWSKWTKASATFSNFDARNSFSSCSPRMESEGAWLRCATRGCFQL